MKLSTFVLLATLLALSTAQQQYIPIVVMHGVLGTAAKMQPVKDWIEEAMPGAYVKLAEIGNGAVTSLWMPMTDQVAAFCEMIYSDPQLARGFNLIGFSQGALLARSYIQRCNKYPVINFFSWVSPQAGQFGGLTDFLPPILEVILHNAPYKGQNQALASIFQYWRDPYNLEEYRNASWFLPDINNEREVKNQTYKENITKLKTMILLYATHDIVVGPTKSGWFEFWLPFTGPGPNGIIVPLNQSLLYIEDWLGLRVLDRTGRLVRYESDCDHHAHPTEDCKEAFDQYTLPILKQPWSEVEEFWSRMENGEIIEPPYTPVPALDAHLYKKTVVN